MQDIFTLRGSITNAAGEGLPGMFLAIVDEGGTGLAAERWTSATSRWRG